MLIQTSKSFNLNNIYELRQISVWGQRYPKRKMHLNRIGLFDSQRNAEESMRLDIQAEKEQYKSWGRDDYKKECLGYLISSQQVLHRELPDFSYHPKWWSYNADGEPNDHSLATEQGAFYGRPTEKVCFQVGDFVEVLGYDSIELAIVGMLPPTPERYEELKQRWLEKHDDCPSLMDESDDCYLVYTIGEGDTHQHIECYKVFPPSKPVPPTIARKLRDTIYKQVQS